MSTGFLSLLRQSPTHVNMAQVGPRYWQRLHGLADEMAQEVGNSCGCGRTFQGAMRGFHAAVSVHLGKEAVHPEDLKRLAAFVGQAAEKAWLRMGDRGAPEGQAGFLVPIGSRCRDPLSGEFVPLIRCRPFFDTIDIAPVVRQFQKFANEVRPAFEKGSEMALVGINTVASAIPALGKKGSVHPAPVDERTQLVGYIHNHPSGGIGLSRADLHYAGYLSALSPFRKPMLAIAVHQFLNVGVYGKPALVGWRDHPVVVGLVSPNSGYDRPSIGEGVGPRDSRVGGQFDPVSRAIEATFEDIRLWEWPAAALEMRVPNVYFQDKG